MSDLSVLLESVKPLHAEVIQWRRHLHANPELSHREFQTADFVRNTLHEIGISETRTLAGTGIVAEIGNGNGPKIGLRGDMDALPIQEESGEPFSSLTPGVMHACGHDAHTAMLLGAAKYLKVRHDTQPLNGTVRLIFQPAEETQDEEGKSGGQKMTEEGVTEGLDYIFGQHVTPGLLTGKIGAVSGPTHAASDYLFITVRGKSGHAATPHLAVDAIAISGILISTLHQIVSRKIAAQTQAVVTIGTINGGTQQNIIADEVRMEGTIRSFTPESRAILFKELENLSQIAEAMGGRAEIKIRTGYPVNINQPELVEKALQNIKNHLGEEVIESLGGPGCGAEDFSFMSREVPGCFFRLGVKHPDWQESYGVHKKNFRLDENALLYGVANFAAQAISFLQ